MVASVQNPADLVNVALARIGSKHSVGDLYDGSAQSNIALNVYAQTRDAVLRSNDWDFAQKIAAAVASGGTAPQPWSFEYAYPVDCLRIRNVFGTAYLADKNSPVPVRYKIGQSVAFGRVLWANISGATFVYTQQVTNPLVWEPLFVEMFSIELAKRLSLSLGTPDAIKVAMEDEKMSVPMADGVMG